MRHADLKGYSYSREDVSAKELATAYSQTLHQIFTHEMKPYEVELLVAEVGHANDDHAEMYHVLYDGVVIDEQRLLGARRLRPKQITEALKDAVHRRAGASAPRQARRARCSAPTANRSAPSSSKSRCSNGPGPAARSAASRTPSSKASSLTPVRASPQSSVLRESAPRDRHDREQHDRDRHAPARHAAVADRRPIVVEDLVGLVDLVDQQHEARFVGLSSGTNTSTRARSPTVTAYGTVERARATARRSPRPRAERPRRGRRRTRTPR